DPLFLTWPQLTRLESMGIEIGSHTVDHVELPTLSQAQATKELVGSRRALERHLGHPVQWFAYPAGRFDATAVQRVRDAGYVLAVTTEPGSDHSAQQPLELSRVRISDDTSVQAFASLLGG